MFYLHRDLITGRATAIALVQKGWNVSIVARRREELEITASRCGGDRYPFSAKLRICVGDVTDEAFVKYVFEDAVKIFGRLNLFCHDGKADT